MPVSTHRTSPSGELPFGREERAGEVAGRRPWSVRHPGGHHLPDRIEDVGVRTRIENRAEERRREVGLTDAGRDALLHFGDGTFGDPQALAHARQLVQCLDRLRRTDHTSAIGRRIGREQDRPLTAQGVGPLVHRDHGLVRHETTEFGREELHALVEVEVHRTVDVIGRQLHAEAIVLAHGGEEVRPLVAREDDRNGLLEVCSSRVGQWPDRAGRVGDVGVAEQHQCVEPLLRA